MRNRAMFSLLVIICACVTMTPGWADTAKPALPLEAIFNGDSLQSHNLQNLQWSADGTRFSYTRRNPSTGLADMYEQRAGQPGEQLLLSSQQLVYQGQNINMGSYHWSADRRFLLFSGPRVRTWDSVMEAAWYIYDASNQAVWALAEGRANLRNVYLSPTGRHAGYVFENNLYLTELESGETHAVTDDGSENIFNGIYDYGSTEFGFTDAWQWSPDGRKIAFWRLDVTDVKVFWIIDELGKYNEVHALKYPNTAEKHAVNQIGVYDLDKQTTTWMDVGDNPDDYIPKIDWTRASDKLAIQRLTRKHQLLDLLMADAVTGESGVIVSDRDPAWIEISRDLKMLKGSDQFVWTSEKSGFRHAYLYDYQGKERQLTRGDWAIDSLIGLDEAAGWLYFYAKKDSLIDQHVYRVSLSGGPVEKLSGVSGWYEWNLSPDGKQAIETYSSASTPPVISLREPAGGAGRTLLENRLQGLVEYAVPNPEFFQFSTDDGITLNAYMIKPTNFDPTKKYPVIAYGYGNAGSQMVVNRWGSSRGAQRDLWHRYMAQQGYIIFSMDNRTTAGRGKQAKNLTYGEYGKWAVLDQLQGLRHLATLSFVDMQRVGFWGWSGGGYLTAAMMTKGAPHYKVGVSVAPVIDITNYQAVGVERWMGLLEENQAGYDAVNLMNFADKLEGDLLLIHGTGDENVKFAFTLQFANSLINAGKQFDMMVYPNEHHGIEGHRQHVYTKIRDYFFDKL